MTTNDDRAVSVELTIDEMIIINNALNEISNGIDLGEEFETRMGCSRDAALELLKRVHSRI